MRAWCWLILTCLWLLPFNLQASEEARAGTGRWQLEVSGGILFPADNDLNLFTEAENHYLDLYFRTVPSLQTINDPGLKKLWHMFSGGAAIHYRLGKRFSISAGLRFLYGSGANSEVFTFRNDQGWRILTDSLDYRALDTHLSLIFPNLGLGYHFPLSAKMALETGISAGPVFARARLKRHIQDRIEVLEREPTSNYLMYQDERVQSMKGTGTGFGAAFNVRLKIQINQRMGIFVETGCDFYSVNSLKGTGTLVAGDQTREWEGEWFMVGEEVEKSWGSAEFRYPANDPNLRGRSVGDFRLRIFCFPSLRIGFYVDL